jgi:hypothetical protein
VKVQERYWLLNEELARMFQTFDDWKFWKFLNL